MDGRRQNRVRCQTVHQQANRRYIRQRVQSAHLMEVNLRHRHAVDPTFCLSQPVIDRQNIRLHRLRHLQVHQMADVRKTAVTVSVSAVIVFMAAFLPAVNQNRHMRSANPAFHGILPAVLYIGKAQPVQLRHKVFRIREQFQQSRREHIPRRTHGAVQIQGFQCVSSPLAVTWLIILARYPAPKPLSMLTTDTPLAQELSMDSNAARPWKDAP